MPDDDVIPAACRSRHRSPDPSPHRAPRRRTIAVASAAVALATALLVSCGSPDTATTAAGGSEPSSTSAPATSTPATGAAPASTAAPGGPGSTAKGGASTSTTAGAGRPGTTAAPTTIPGTDPGTLPQTEDKPTASGQQWDDATRGLWDAIVTDDVSKARPFFFPLAAYKQVKAISDPAGDYDRRLIAYYEQDIHALHAQLGSNADKATFVRVDVPATAQWIKPGVEYNKGAYWRVFDSKLVYKVDGKEKSFLVKSMISWRGEWYVVHLSSVR